MKNKIMSMILIMALITSSIAVQKSFVKASTIGNNETQEDAGNCTDKKEYVIVAENAKANNTIENLYKSDIVDREEEADINSCNYTHVMELTDTEADRIEKSDDVMFVEPNIMFKVETNDSAESTGEDDTLEEDPGPLPERFDDEENNHWNIDFIHAKPEEVEDSTGNGIKIAVLDSGASLSEHLNVSEYVDIVGNDLEDPLDIHYDVTGHGTGVTGIIRDLSSGASIKTIRVFDEDNQAPLSRIIAGIQWAIDNKVNIINMSFGTSINSEILHQKIREAYNVGIILVAAAGNTGNDNGESLYPAAYDEVISVGAVDGQGKLSDFSAKYDYTEILAPGEGIITNSLFDGYMSVSGTSAAAPHVSAAAALLWSSIPNASSDYIRKLLCATANRSTAIDVGDSGILDVKNAFDEKENFKEVYSPQTVSYSGLVETESNLDTYDSDLIVEGCWRKDKHSKNIYDEDLQERGKTGKLFSGVATKYIRLMAMAAYKADEYYPIGGKYKRFYPLHAYGYTSGITKDDRQSLDNNYVADLKYLYRLAKYYFNESSVYEADKHIYDSKYTKIKDNDARSKFLQDLVSLNSVICKVEQDDESVINVKGIAHMNLISGIEESTPYAVGWKILGLAAHMAGDIYAHRTRVPISSLEPGKTFDEKGPIVYRDDKHHSGKMNIHEYLKAEYKYKDDAVCCCNTCVRGAIQAGHVEFRDLKYILKDDKNVALVPVNGIKIKNYQMGMDDRTDVYSQRYETATDNAIYELMNRFVNGGDFSIYVLLPQDEKYTLKLNNLKNFILATKTKWENLSSKTQELVEKLSTSELI